MTTPPPRAVGPVTLWHNPAYPKMWKTDTWEPRAEGTQGPWDYGVLPPIEYRALPAADFDALQARLAAAEWVVGAARVVATDVLAAAGHRLTWKEKDALLALRASLPTPPAPSTDKENA